MNDKEQSGSAPAPAEAKQAAANEIVVPGSLPILPLRNIVLFPGMVSPLSINRPASLKMLDESLPENRAIGVIAQRDPEKNDVGPDDLYRVGVAGVVLKLLRQPEDGVLLVVQGVNRFGVREYSQTEPFLRAEIEPLVSREPETRDKHWEATIKSLRQHAVELMSLNPDVAEQGRVLVMNIENEGQLADFLAGHLPIELAEKQNILEELDVVRRVREVQRAVSSQLEIARLQQKISKDVQAQFSDVQRRAYLREQVQAIQRELGEGDGQEEQLAHLRQQLEEAKPPEAVMKQAERELNRLKVVPSVSPEYSMIAGYLETLASLPWSKLSEDNLDLDRAQKILDRDHFDLEKIKRRLIEYLAVRKLNPEGRGPILCFLGPPGVGKTSLGKSIADALGREFCRMSLGGMRDEAEIRGHRRTYIGAMPGRIIQEMRRLGARNPVFMLDEVDKIGADFRGDPASALLEVLDPRQNDSFVDHFLDVPFDLSQVLFIATANSMDTVPPALRDRMEVIEIPGYTEREKLAIARGYLIPRQIKENGLKPEQCQFRDATVTKIIGDYTHEAGVRELERQIGAVCRGVAAQVARGKTDAVTVTPAFARKLLGPAKYVRETKLKTSAPGVVTGLAFTPAGGEILHVEAARYAGKGHVQLTGNIGDVMKESAQAALSLVRSRAQKLGIKPEDFRTHDIHVHVPSGAVPKDGPSAGVAMFTAIASLFAGAPVRSDVAMTGEISLRGIVLPIGGLKEKTLAAMRAGIGTVIIPKLNEKDLPELPPEVRRKLNFVCVDDVDAVLHAALQKVHRRNGAPTRAHRSAVSDASERQPRQRVSHR
jgi:ATP-dependent Lon protease